MTLQLLHLHAKLQKAPSLPTHRLAPHNLQMYFDFFWFRFLCGSEQSQTLKKKYRNLQCFYACVWGTCDPVGVLWVGISMQSTGQYGPQNSVPCSHPLGPADLSNLGRGEEEVAAWGSIQNGWGRQAPTCHTIFPVEPPLDRPDTALADR